MTAVERYTFEVAPAGWDGMHDEDLAFEPFLMDVPTLSGVDFAARRAWWSAFHALGPKGFEPEDFEVHEWDGARARRVYMGGFEPPT